MQIVIDNIVFSLQKSGGISVVWSELLKRLIQDKTIDLKLLGKPKENMFFDLLQISNEHYLKDPLEQLPLQIYRYLEPRVSFKGIFHSTYYRTVNFPGVRNVTTVHDFTYEFYRKGISKTIHTKQKASAIKKSDHLICISENTKRDLLTFFPNVDENKISVINNGISNTYKVLKEESEGKLKLLIPFSSGEYAIYVGDRKSSHKNFNLAVQSCASTKTPLVVVGGGELSKVEESHLREFLGSAFFRPGKVDNESLNLLYNHSLCLIYPSLYEGFGIPILEAQQAGCPVIASHNSSIPEVIGQVDTLLHKSSILNYSEMINTLKEDKRFKSQQIAIGIENAKRFTWEKCYTETRQVYETLY